MFPRDAHSPVISPKIKLQSSTFKSRVSPSRYSRILRKVMKFETLILLLSLFISSHSLHKFPDSNVYSSFNGRTYCNPSSKIQRPINAEQIIKIVKEAISSGNTVKAIGSQHSITDVICTDGIPISMRRIKYGSVKEGNGDATFGSGMEVGEVMTFLEKHNRTLPIVPAYSGITIGGAIGTGAHGSSLRHPATISDQVVALTVIAGNGSILRITAEDDVNAFKVHLGLLGIVIDVTVKTIPLVKLRLENRLESGSILFDGQVPVLAKKQDVYQLWWFPNLDQVVTATGHFVPPDTPGNASSNFIFNEFRFGIAKSRAAFEFLQGTRNTVGLDSFGEFAKRSLYAEVVGKPPIYSEDGEILNNAATGFPWRLQSSTCAPSKYHACSWDNGDNSIYPDEVSLAFDLTEFDRVMKAIKKILRTSPYFSLLGFFIRFLKSSTSLTSISNGRESFTVGWITPIREDPYKSAPDQLGISQTLIQELIANHGARPHWGKNGLHYFTQRVLEKTFPNRAHFILAMKKFDPNGIFGNKFGRRILGISDEMDVNPRVQRCAIQDYCLCQRNSDCAPFQACAERSKFRVCVDVHPSTPHPIDFTNLSNISAILGDIESILYSRNDEFAFRKFQSARY